MAGSVGAATKRYLLTERLPAEPALAQVQVAYSFPASIERECIYGGQVSGPVQLSAMAMAGGLVARREDLVLQLHIWVSQPGERDTATAEARASELARVVEELVAGDPTLSGAVDGLKLAAVTNVLLDSGTDDDGAMAELTLQIALLSHIR